MKKILTYLILLLTATAHAQNFPVQSTVFIAPPYSVYLSDYASASSQKMTVNLLLKDVLQQGIQVKLRVTIKGNGVELRSKPEFAPPPLILSGGVPLQVSGTDLESYLLPANLNFSGLDKQEFLKTGKLPEGVYQFMVEAVEYRRDVAISNQGMTIGWLVLNDPPRWTLPMANSLLTATYPQNVFFSWMPMNTSSPNSAFSTEYEFTLVEIWPADRNPNDAINSTVPLFQTTTNNTSLLYGPGEPELTPGRKYVCRLRAKDTEGRDLFKNHGYSEILTFTFGMACKPPNTINHTVQSDEQARVDWISLPGNDQFILSYSEKNNDGTWSNWYNNETMMPWSNIEGLKADHTYRYRIQADCGTLQSAYSEIKEFNTPKKDTAEIECGKDLSIPLIDGSPPLQNLKPGDMINVGGFDARIIEANGSNGTFSGKCVVHVKTFKFWVQSEFTDIGINQSMQVTSGTINAIKGKLHLLNIDAIMDSINNYLDDKNDENNGNPNVGDPYIPGDPITVIIDGETIVVTGDTTFTTADGTEVVVTLSGQPPIIIVDGKTTEVTTDVLDFDNPGGTGNTVAGTVTDTSAYAIKLVTFKPIKKQLFGFDKYEASIPQLLFNYNKERVNNESYVVPAKSAESFGMSEMVILDIKTENPDSIKTRLSVESDVTGSIPFIYDPTDKAWEISITGQTHESIGRITAYYKQDNGTKIAIGHLDLASYNKQKMKLVLVPVGNLYTIDKQALTDSLNSIYKSSITYWDVSVTAPLSVDFEDNDKPGLDTDLPGIAAYTKEMRNINNAMEKLQDYDKDAYYLFLIDKSENGDKKGIMPFRRNFGYIFMNEGGRLLSGVEVYHTVAHELGHGAFCLKHPWTEKGTSEGQTYSIMDYRNDLSNNLLYHYQWDEVHDPKSSLFGGDEEETSESEGFNDPATIIINSVTKSDTILILLKGKSPLERIEAIRKYWEEWNKPWPSRESYDWISKCVINKKIPSNPFILNNRKFNQEDGKFNGIPNIVIETSKIGNIYEQGLAIYGLKYVDNNYKRKVEYYNIDYILPNHFINKFPFVPESPTLISAPVIFGVPMLWHGLINRVINIGGTISYKVGGGNSSGISKLSVGISADKDGNCALYGSVVGMIGVLNLGFALEGSGKLKDFENQYLGYASGFNVDVGINKVAKVYELGGSLQINEVDVLGHGFSLKFDKNSGDFVSIEFSSVGPELSPEIGLGRYKDITGIFAFTLEDYYRIKTGINAFFINNVFNPLDYFLIEFKREDNFGQSEFHMNIYKDKNKNNTIKTLAIFLIDKKYNCLKTINVK